MAFVNTTYLTKLAGVTPELDAFGAIARVGGPVSSKASRSGNVTVHLPRVDTSFARREVVVVAGSLACHYAAGADPDPSVITTTASDVAAALTCPACREAFDKTLAEVNAGREQQRLTTGIPQERRTAAVEEIMRLCAQHPDVHRVLKDAVRTHGLTTEGQLNLEALYEALYPRSHRDH